MQFTIFIHDQQASVGVAKYENLKEMLLKTSLLVENYLLRAEVLKRIKEIIVSKSGQPDMNYMLPIVKMLLIDIQEKSETIE
jgi:hypothetical protein